MIGREAVDAVIGRAERKSVLVDVGGLRVERPGIGFGGRRQRKWLSLGVVAIIETESQGMQVEIAVKALRAGGENDIARAEAGDQIFKLRGPLRQDRNLDASADSEARAHLRDCLD